MEIWHTAHEVFLLFSAVVVHAYYACTTTAEKEYLVCSSCMYHDHVGEGTQCTVPCQRLSACSTRRRTEFWRKSQVSESPDGNGGVYPSLKRSGVLDKCAGMGIEYLHVFGVDNILVKPADPRFIGCCLERGAVEVGNKSVWKADKVEVFVPMRTDEKVGVIALKNDAAASKPKYCVVEYSEMPDAAKAQLDPTTNKLAFGAGNICNHVFSLNFLQDKVLPNMQSQYHVAEKKIPCVHPETGELVKPSENNGVKLETFIFDSFPLADSFALLECKREEEFAPIKNAAGSDSPESALAMLQALHKSWIERAGGSVEGDQVVEVSPLVSYAGEGLAPYVKGKVFLGPCVVDESALTMVPNKEGGHGASMQLELDISPVRRRMEGCLCFGGGAGALLGRGSVPCQ